MSSQDEQRTPQEIAAELDSLRELDALDVMELDTLGDPAAEQRSLPALRSSIWLTIRISILIMAGVVLVVAAIFRYKSPVPVNEPVPVPQPTQQQITPPVMQVVPPPGSRVVRPSPTTTAPVVDAREIRQQLSRIYKWRLDLGEGIRPRLIQAPDSALYVSYRPKGESGVLLKLSPAGKELWRYEPGSSGSVNPYISSDNRVYVSATDNPFAKESELVALDNRGRERWRVSYDGVSTATACAPAGGVIYLATNPSGSGNQGRNRRLLAVDQRGQVVWSHDYELGSSYSGHKRNLCVGPDGTVYFASSTGFNRDKIHRLEALTPAGAAKWSFDSPEQYIGEVLPLADGRLLISLFGSDRCTGSVGLLSRQGKLVWQEHNGASNAADMFALNGANVHFLTDELNERFDHTYHLVTLRVADGKELWRMPATEYTKYTVAPDGNLYAGIAGDLVKIRPDGTVLWRNPASSSTIAPQLGSDGNIYTSSQGIRATTPAGKELFHFRPESIDMGLFWLGPDDTLYFTTHKGQLMAVEN